MSAFCLYVLRNCSDAEQLQNELANVLYELGCGILFNPRDTLLLFGQLHIQQNDLLFSPTDAPDSPNSDLLLYPDYYSINSIFPFLPFMKRANLFQKLAQISLQYTEKLDIFIGEDDPYLPDFLIYEVSKDQICQVLMHEYQKSERCLDPIPNICLRVTG